jgi:hypothetical protein
MGQRSHSAGYSGSSTLRLFDPVKTNYAIQLTILLSIRYRDAGDVGFGPLGQ